MKSIEQAVSLDQLICECPTYKGMKEASPHHFLPQRLRKAVRGTASEAFSAFRRGCPATLHDEYRKHLHSLVAKRPVSKP